MHVSLSSAGRTRREVSIGSAWTGRSAPPLLRPNRHILRMAQGYHPGQASHSADSLSPRHPSAEPQAVGQDHSAGRQRSTPARRLDSTRFFYPSGGWDLR